MGRLLHDPDVAKHPFPAHELLNLRHHCHCACSVIVFVCLFELLVHRHIHAAKLPKSLDSYGLFQLAENDPFMFGSGRGGVSVAGTVDMTADMVSTRGATGWSCIGRDTSAECGVSALRLIDSFGRCVVPVVLRQVVCCISALTVRVEQNKQQTALRSSSEKT